MSNSPLTPRQRDVYDYLVAHADEPPPTLEALGRALGLRSRGSLHRHVQALVDAGLVEPLDGKKRGIRLRSEHADQGADANNLPLLGRIAAGAPIEALPQPETFEVPPKLRRGQSAYVLQVTGDSMADDGIWDGDWVVVEERDHASNGDRVIALIDGEQTTLKRIEQKPDVTILHPANTAYAPQEYSPDRVQVQGVVVSQMRRFF